MHQRGKCFLKNSSERAILPEKKFEFVSEGYPVWQATHLNFFPTSKKST